ncbi:MAG: RDD family protein [Gemmatimonadetes bacterium]|nr:RDD family protein [Gemmatimonadota bacterium]NNM03856.1 RDD family protein [Gemmatimonadota bacterium]
MDRRLDPRSIVTPYAFAVHPDLLGHPLATPGQRLGAILIDLVVIGFIAQIGAAPLAIGSVALLFWLAFRKPGRDVLGKVFRIAVGCLGFLILGVTVLVIVWIRWGDVIQETLDEADSGITIQGTGALSPEELARGEGETSPLIGILQGIGGYLDLQRAEGQEEAQALLNEFVGDAYDAGLDRGEIRDVLIELLPQDAPWSSAAQEMVEMAIDNLSPPPEVTPVGGENVVEEDSVAPFSEAAADSIDRLNRALRISEDDREVAETDLARAREDLEAERNKGFLAWLLGLVDDLGIGFGWAALYLTVTHAWWKGTSVGKKIFRIRVVMIDKRPLNWWLSFERAGGYAAGFATGLLGFAQIFWDPNRQAIHDKVSETIVIQDGREAVPGPWMEEGRAMWKSDTHGAQETP